MPRLATHAKIIAHRIQQPSTRLARTLDWLRKYGTRARPSPRRRALYLQVVEDLARMLEDGLPKAEEPLTNGYSAPTPEAPKEPGPPWAHSRTYATIRPLRLACPKCDAIILASWGQAHYEQYDPLTGILTCPRCSARYQLGLLVWPLRKARVYDRPVDQVPSVRQLAEIRQLTNAQYLDEALKKPSRSSANRYVEEGCTCENPREIAPACPVHGQGRKELPCDGSLGSGTGSPAEPGE